MKLAFVVHFNQHLNEFAAVASRACYRGLLTVLRRHPRLRFNIHISGTLAHALNWLDPEPLDLIRAGLADGQFELLGSTYAQNIPYATDDWDNAQQMALHREVLEDLFGVRPVGFWNPERTWRQSLAPLIAAGGYRYTLMEDHILRRAGAEAPHVYATPAGTDRSLRLYWDDEPLKHRVNFAAWFGQPDAALGYLRDLAARPGAEDFCLAYAEDAEAMGLWGWHQGVIPNQAWAHLDTFLTRLESEDGLEVIRLSDGPAPTADLGPIPDGCAAWMDAALRRPDAPYHEDGYADWFDFNARSPKTLRFRRLYGAIRRRLQSVGAALSDPGFTAPIPPAARTAVQRLYREAIWALLSHQYEFGCIGVGGKGYRGWEQAVSAFALARAAEIAAAGRTGLSIEDVTGDGADEVLLMDGERLAILSTYGARLLYWFDLRTGMQHVGNQLAVPHSPFKGDSKLTDFDDLPEVWLPEVTEPRLDGLEAYRVEEPAPTRMARYLPEANWPSGAAVPLYVRPVSNGARVTPRPAQRRALNDFVAVDGGPEMPPNGLLDYRFENGGVLFLRHLPDRLIMEKYFCASPDGLEVTYRFGNRSDSPRQVRLRVLSELTPDYAVIRSHGRRSLVLLSPKGACDAAVGVANALSGTAVKLEPNRAPDAVECRESLLGLEVGLTFGLSLPARSSEAFGLKVTLRPGG